MLSKQAHAASTNGAAAPARGRRDTELLVFHGGDRAALLRAVRATADDLRAHPATDLTDLARALNSDLPAGGCRLAVVAATAPEALARLERAGGRLADPRCTFLRDAAGLYFAAQPLHPEGKIAFLFPGEGAQYLGMLGDLRAAFPEVAALFAECDEALARAGGRPLTAVFLPPEGAGESERARAEEELRRLDHAMMSVLMADWALHQLLRGLGLTPDVVAGHSMGELAALWAAGALEADGLSLTHVGAALEAMRRQEEGGAEAVLLAVGAGRASLAELLAAPGDSPVCVAMDNCPHQAVIVGPPGPMAAVEAELQRRHVVCERLPFRRPYHTPLFEPLLEPMKQLFGTARFHPPRLPVYSCTTARPFPDDPAEIRRLAIAHWAEPVRFTELIENLHADGVRFFVESGPRGNLSAFVEDILRGKPFVALPANVMRRSGLTQLHHLLGCLAAHHVPLRLDRLYQQRTPAPHARGQVLTQYLGVMEQFLDLQRETTELFLRRRRSTRTVERTEYSVLSTQYSVLPRTGGNGAPPPGRPMIGTIGRHVAGRELVMRRVLDLREDNFAADHTVGGRRVSKVDPGQHGLPVMPMTFTLEMMAEAAAVLAPGKVLTAIRKVQLFRWLGFDEEEPGAVELAARVTDAGGPVLVEVEVRDLGSVARPAPSPRLAARATLALDAAYPAAPAAVPFRLSGERTPTVSLEQLYLNLFHGPLFQGVRSVDRVGDEGLESQVEVLPRQGLFRSTPEPDLMLDPVLLDVVMHPLASWHLEQPDQAGRILLPVGMDSLELFGPPPAPGTRLTSRGRVSATAVRSFVHEVEAVGGDGRVWGRLNGVKYWRFYVPFGRVNFHGPKDQYFLSRRWSEVEAQAQAGGGPLAIVRLEPPTDLQQAALNLVTARVTLTPEEMRAFRRLPRGGAETKAWLFDRIAVKDAVRVVWRELHGERLFPADIDTVAGPAGLYRAGRRGTADQSFPAAVVDRAGGVTAALSAAGAPMLGLALALTDGAGPDESAPFDSEEERLLAAWGGDRTETALRFRCARRAVTRALGLGPEAAGTARVRGGDTRTGRLTVAVAEERWLAHTARDGAAVVAWALGERGER
jgi:malonyl CoA-acyl carrier protein transacylase